MRAEPDDLDVVADLRLAAFDPSCADRPSSGDGENVLHRHQERLIHVALRDGDVRIHRVHQLFDALECGIVPLAVGFQGRFHRLEGAAADDGDLVPRKLILLEQVPELEFHEIEQFGIVHRIHLVHENHHAGNAHLTGKNDVFARLGHRTVGRRNNENGTVHLGGARDHVLHVIGMARAVHVRIMTLRR